MSLSCNNMTGTVVAEAEVDVAGVGAIVHTQATYNRYATNELVIKSK